MSHLEENLRLLLRCAYRPVLPAPEFRERLAADLSRRARKRLPRPQPLWLDRHRQWKRVAAAAGILLALLIGVLALDELRDTAGSTDRRVLVGGGLVACREDPLAPWRPLSETEREQGIEWVDEYLALVTPEHGPLDVRFPGEGSIHAKTSSELVLHRRAANPASEPAGLLEIELVRGGIRMRRATSSPHRAWQLDAADGRVLLDLGDMEVDQIAESGTALWLAHGKAWVDTDEGLMAVPEGKRLWLRKGRIASEEPDEGVALGARSPVDPDPSPLPGAASVFTDPTRGGIQGVVRGPDGEQLDRFQVALLRSVVLPSVSHPAAHRFDEAQGRFEIPGLQPGEYTAFVLAPSFAVKRLGSLAVRAGELTQVGEVQLARGAKVRGIVVEAANGKPIEGALVLSEPDAPYQVIESAPSEVPELAMACARTDARGSFELDCLSPGPQILRASHPGFAPAWSGTFEVKEDGLVEGFSFQMQPGGGVHGRVRRPDGTPWANTVLVASLVDYTGSRSCMTYGAAQTDSEGAFAIKDLAPGAYAIVHVGNSADATVMAAIVNAGESTLIEIPRKEGARLFGVVIGADGAPLADCGLFLERAGESDDPDWGSTRSDSSGRYFFSGLESGSYDLYVGRKTFTDFVRYGGIALAENEDRDCDLVLGRASFSGTVRVAATDATCPSAVVILERLESSSESIFAGKAISDSRGVYGFEYLEPGRYRVLAFPAQPDLATAILDELSLLAGNHPDPVDFELVAGGGAQVCALDPSGQPVQGATVLFRDGAGRTLSPARDPRTGENGVYMALGLLAGAWDVEVTHRDFAPSTVRFVVEAGVTVPVEVVLRRENVR